MKLAAWLIPLALFATSAQAQRSRPRTPAAAAPAIPMQTLDRVLRDLSSDAFEGRAPATHGEEMTVPYVQHAFQQAGLQPGNHGGWTQDVPTVEITVRPVRGACPAMPAGVDATCVTWPQLQIAGGREPLAFDYRTDFVAASYRVQPHVSFANSDMVFVGYGINAPERGWNDYAGIDVRGKTVVILVNDPDWQTPTVGGLFNGRAMTYYGRWTYKFEEAARQGAAAALIVHDSEPAAYGWATVENSWTGSQLYLDDGRGGADQTVANGWLTNAAAHRLFAAAGQDLDALTRAAQQRGFRAVPLNLRASLGIDNGIRRQASRNVVGILPGRTHPDEYVLYTAHWDHLGICAETGADRICNGAVDNASGVAALVALAEAHARAGAAGRSLVFIAVTGEESGLLGSKYYAEHPIYPLDRTAGGVNMDSLGVVGDFRDFVSVGAGKSSLDDYARRALAAEQIRMTPEPSPQAGSYYRSDHFSFAKLGVPMFYGEPGEDLVRGGTAAGAAASSDYRAHRYHQVGDEYDPHWDMSGAAREVRIYYRIGRALADGRDWPNWLPGDEFRAIRDRSTAARTGR